MCNTAGKAQRLTMQLKHNIDACIQIHNPKTLLLSCCPTMEQLQLWKHLGWKLPVCLMVLQRVQHQVLPSLMASHIQRKFILIYNPTPTGTTWVDTSAPEPTKEPTCSHRVPHTNLYSLVLYKRQWRGFPCVFLERDWTKRKWLNWCYFYIKFAGCGKHSFIFLLSLRKLMWWCMF